MTAPTGLARVTISTPQRRVDVALPEYVPVAELLPELLRHAGEGLADDGERHGGWLLRRTDGESLASATGLHAQGVRDGEILHLVPARAQWPELEYDDAVEAIAAGARRIGRGWTAAASRATGAAAAGAALAAGLVALVTSGPSWTVPAFAGLGVAMLLTLAGIMASRGYGEGMAGAALAGYAMPYAFTGGALLVAGDGPGRLGWLGAPQLLVGSATLLLVAALGAVGVSAVLRLFAAGITLGILGALGALLGYLVPAPGAVAIVLSLLVCGIGALPLLAIRLGKVPMPAVTLPVGTAGADLSGAAQPGSPALEAARERPDRERVFAAVRRTESILTGMLLGHAAAVAVGAVLLATAGGLAGRLLVLVGSLTLLLRARLFVTVRHRVPILAAGFSGLAVLAVATVAGPGGPAPDGGGLGWVAVLVAVALVAVVAGSTYASRPPSPYLGRAADVIDMLLVVSVIPIACAVLGLYGRVRNLTG